MYKFKDVSGQNFGRLTAIKITRRDKNGHDIWLCKCDCGNTKEFFGSNLRRGLTNSCGCYKIEMRYKHGMTGTPTHRTWSSMRQRCNNPNNDRYYDYGGRGIKVCKSWHKFENFYKDMGDRPNKTTLDRVDNEKGYYKANCKWSTPKEQQNNMRNNHWITFNSETKTLSQWAREKNVYPHTLLTRIKRGWSVERALCQNIIKRR